MARAPTAALPVAMDEPRRSQPASWASDLSRRMQRGEEDAFREFHEQFYRRMYAVALQALRGDDAAAAEVTQDALLRISRYIKPIEREDILWRWTARIVRTAATDFCRKASRYRQRLENAPLPQVREPGDAARWLTIALDRLPAGQRELFLAKYEEGATTRELARAHQTSEHAMESRLARIRERLRAAVLELMRHA